MESSDGLVIPTPVVGSTDRCHLGSKQLIGNRRKIDRMIEAVIGDRGAAAGFLVSEEVYLFREIDRDWRRKPTADDGPEFRFYGKIEEAMRAFESEKPAEDTAA